MKLLLKDIKWSHQWATFTVSLFPSACAPLQCVLITSSGTAILLQYRLDPSKVCQSSFLIQNKARVHNGFLRGPWSSPYCSSDLTHWATICLHLPSPCCNLSAFLLFLEPGNFHLRVSESWQWWFPLFKTPVPKTLLTSLGLCSNVTRSVRPSLITFPHKVLFSVLASSVHFLRLFLCSTIRQLMFHTLIASLFVSSLLITNFTRRMIGLILLCSPLHFM